MRSIRHSGPSTSLTFTIGIMRYNTIAVTAEDGKCKVLKSTLCNYACCFHKLSVIKGLIKINNFLDIMHLDIS